jgi:hypothetical protein
VQKERQKHAKQSFDFRPDGYALCYLGRYCWTFRNRAFLTAPIRDFDELHLIERLHGEGLQG